MAAALAVTNLNHSGTATVTLSGDTGSAVRVITILDPDGRTQTFTVTNDGGGGASVKFVPQLSGAYTVTVSSVAATVVTKTMNSSHL
jgi:hypothetical protein